MRVSLKWLIVWLLALALPVQAVASAAMAHCGPSHQRMHVVQLDTDASASASHHHAGPDGDSHHRPDASQAAPSDHDTTQADALTDPGNHRCSACASCCSVCALLSVMPQLAEPEFTATVFAAVVPTVDPFAADGLERPPRIDLA